MSSFTKRTYAMIVIFVGLMVCLPGSVTGQGNPQLQFDNANDQLESGNYIGALDIYRSILDQGHVSGSLFLNMGISYVQLDSLGKAKYYFLKAQQFEETSDRAEQGLEFVEARFSRQSAVLPKLPWQRFFDWLGTVTGPTTLLGIGILLLNLAVFSFMGGWFLPEWEKPLRIGALSVASVSVLIILSSFYLQYLQNRYSRAVMVHQQAELLEQPAPDAALVSQAYEGYTFTVDHNRSSEQPGWSYVRMSNGLYGWISNDEIMVL